MPERPGIHAGLHRIFYIPAEERDLILKAARERARLIGGRPSAIGVVRELLLRLLDEMKEHPVTPEERLSLPGLTKKDPVVAGIVPIEILERLPTAIREAGVPGANSLLVIAVRRYLR